VIHGKPSPRVGRRSRDCAAAGRAVVDVEVVDAGVVVGAVTVWATDAETAMNSTPSVSSPITTARRTGAKVVEEGVG
jgi:hypothetical protein